MEHMSNSNPSPFSTHRHCHHAVVAITPSSPSLAPAATVASPPPPSHTPHFEPWIEELQPWISHMYFSPARSTSWLMAFTIAIFKSGAMLLAILAIPILAWSFTAALSFRSIVAFVVQIQRAISPLHRSSFSSSSLR
ncbi:hypothetical protein PIB30_041642, partial [Stylosanthes scabra]|nr:hypothetical protein [Stylosanthes scabra]